MPAIAVIFELAGLLAEAGFGEFAQEIVDEAGADIVERDPDSVDGESRRPLSADEQIDGAVTLIARRLIRSQHTMHEAESMAGRLSRDRDSVPIILSQEGQASGPADRERRARVRLQLEAVLGKLRQDLRSADDGI